MKEIELSGLDTLYDKKVQCPFCSHSFTSKKVRIKFIKPLKVDSDFGPIFAKEDKNNPLFYYVIVCPNCGFSFTEDFSKPFGQLTKQKVEDEISKKIDRNIDYCGVRDFLGAERAYKLAIYSGQLIGENHIVFANLCLRLAWINRGTGKKEEERRFLQLAASEFEQSYINTDFIPKNMPEIQILYLIGELNRQLGNSSKAVRYFSAVIGHPEKSKNSKYVNLARSQWKLAADEYRGIK